VIDCQAFRQERIRTEWAEVTSAVWTSKRRFSEDHTGNDRSEYGTDDDTVYNDTRFVLHDSTKLDHIFDVSPDAVFYDENGRIAQPGTSQNTIDLMVDQTIVGRAEYALVKRRFAARFALDKKWDTDIGRHFFHRLTGRQKISVVKKAMQDDGCAGRQQQDNILFISMFRWEEEYRNNSYIGARALRSFLVDSAGFEGKQVQVCDPGNVQVCDYGRLQQLVDKKSNG
jgi:hypothetical protein